MTGLRIEVRPTVGRLLRISGNKLVFLFGYLPFSVDELALLINSLEGDILLRILDLVILGNDRFAISENGGA